MDPISVALIVPAAVFTALLLVPLRRLALPASRFPEHDFNSPPDLKFSLWMDRSLEAACSEVKIVSGWLPDMVYNSPEVIGRLKNKVVKDGITVTIVTARAPAAKEDIARLAEEHPDNVSIWMYHDPRKKDQTIPGRHFRISDDSLLSIEEPHGEFDQRRVLTWITPRVLRGDHTIARYDRWFEVLKESSSRLVLSAGGNPPEVAPVTC